ncbi:MAG: NAD(P)-dependent oxidoreductase [Proteobacteria bacterium]|nr:NAD(P)-dependent oxidoreductase [Pseudomonadota bacterium]
MRIGFIGLGNLGKAIIKRLKSQNFELHVWNRTLSKAEGLEVTVHESPAKLFNISNIVIINLFDSIAVRSVFEMENGILSANLMDKIIIDTTTNNHKEVMKFHIEVSNKGGYYIEAPVLGSVNPALQGNLTILVSGSKDAYNRVENILTVIGSKIFYLEDPGLSTKMKLINNLLLGVFMAGISESLLLAEKCGISVQRAIEILMSGAGNSMVLSAKKDKIINEDYSPHFSSSLIYKDLHYLQELAYELKTTLFTGGCVKELYGLTFSKNASELDFSYIFKLLQELNNNS